jgi:DNA-binding GntR family transcriptional regulator
MDTSYDIRLGCPHKVRLSVVAVALKTFETPKYARIVTALMERITDGTYPHGSMLPSETKLIEEFGASRPVVVRALGILEQDGWLASEPGRGRFVLRTRGRDEVALGAGRAVFQPERRAGVTVLEAGVVPAPPRAANALGILNGTAVVARRRLVATVDGPVELSTVYASADLAESTALGSSKPIREDLLAYVVKQTGIAFDFALDRIGARLPTAEEARLLGVTRREPVLTVLVMAFATTGGVALVVDSVMVPTRAELEDSYPLYVDVMS